MHCDCWYFERASTYIHGLFLRGISKIDLRLQFWAQVGVFKLLWLNPIHSTYGAKVVLVSHYTSSSTVLLALDFN